MIPYILRRLLHSLPTLLILVTLVFLGIRMVPGGPAVAVLGANASAERIADLETRMGLDEPLFRQYFSFLGGIIQGDLGTSITSGRSISEQLVRALPFTIELAIGGTILSLLMGLPLGIVAARNRDSAIDTAARVFSLFGISIPGFLLGIILLLIFSFYWPIFPLMGAGEWSNPAGRLHHLFLPAFVLGFEQAAMVTRVTRSAVLEVVGLDYIRTARAKGLTGRMIFTKHALRNALIPIITIVGLDAARAFGGAVVLEIVFTRPGVGALLVGAIAERDYSVIQSGILVFGGFIVIANLVVDIAYGIADPRIRYS